MLSPTRGLKVCGQNLDHMSVVCIIYNNDSNNMYVTTCTLFHDMIQGVAPHFQYKHFATVYVQIVLRIICIQVNLKGNEIVLRECWMFPIGANKRDYFAEVE